MDLAAAALWVYVVLNFFTVRRNVLDALGTALTTPMTVGAISISASDVLIFCVVLVGGIMLAGVFRVLLQEDLLPRFSLKHGLPNTISTLTYYVLLLVGFLLALAASGVELSKWAILTGGFGLGVGFGLQNIINNLASGLLLLLERPVNVGDILEVEGVTGVVKRIGLRATNVRTFQGAEVIVPNTNLITNRVTNWTLSQRQRRVDLEVRVAYGSEPRRVLELLLHAATSNPNVVQHPAPEAMFLGFGESSLNFVLQFWAPNANHGQLKSEVALKVISDFHDAGIRIPLPQRELHVAMPDAANTAGAPSSVIETTLVQPGTRVSASPGGAAAAQSPDKQDSPAERHQVKKEPQSV
jgi:small-conductance mechanosensitive channel